MLMCKEVSHDIIEMNLNKAEATDHKYQMLNQNMSYQKYAADHRVLIVFQENRKETCMSNNWPFLYPSQSISDKIMQIVKKNPAYWVQQLLCHPKPPQPIRGEWEKSHALYRFSALSPLVQISLEMSNCQQG